MKVLVTGGAGYIGSHTCLEMLEAGMEVVVMDNLNNSTKEALRCVEKLTGKTLKFRRIDLLDEPGAPPNRPSPEEARAGAEHI